VKRREKGRKEEKEGKKRDVICGKKRRGEGRREKKMR
jgi:hypothetical protein